MFNHWADPAVHLLLLDISMTLVFFKKLCSQDFQKLLC